MTGFVVFGLMLVALLATVIFAACRRGGVPDPASTPGARLEIALDALRSLEFEFQTEKISAAEYAEARRELELAAIRARDAQGQNRDGGAACGACGVSLGADERYCAACGAAVGVAHD